MDFGFTDEQQMLRDSIDKFTKKEYPIERARKDDETEEFPSDIFQKMAELGWLGLPFPEEYGGIGGTVVDECMICEELAKTSCTLAVAYFLTVCFGGKTLEHTANEEQKQHYLTKLCAGEYKFCLAITEADGGTDILGSMKTTAVEDGDHYIINGSKMFITGAHVADYMVLVTRTSRDEAKKAWGITLFVVDTKSPGIEIRRLDKVGVKSAGTCEIFFEDVKVPKENLLGVRDKGWYDLTKTLNNERVTLAAIATGTSQACLDLAVKYSKERMAFGKPIGQFQALQHYMAEMSTNIAASRWLTYRAAWLQQVGQPNAVDSAKAKLFASETQLDCAIKGMRIFGGAGYMMEYDMQRFYRDCFVLVFAPITNEMCKNLIGQMELGLPQSF